MKITVNYIYTVPIFVTIEVTIQLGRLMSFGLFIKEKVIIWQKSHT